MIINEQKYNIETATFHENSIYAKEFTFNLQF